VLRKARAGHVTGGRVFGYDNVPVLNAVGQQSHVERRINEREAAVIRRIFELSAAGVGVRSIAKQLNAAGEPAPRSQQGRPVSWSSSSVWEALRRPLYHGEMVWNQTRKRDKWGQRRQQAREASEWVRQPRPDLRIVSDDLWQAAHVRLDGAREDYVRRNAGRTWGRPTNGTESKYLLTGLAQCAWCNGGLFLHSRSHGARRGYFYACTSYHLRGREICANRQLLPMELANGSVLETCRTRLLDPRVMERALSKLEARLSGPVDIRGSRSSRPSRDASGRSWRVSRPHSRPAATCRPSWPPCSSARNGYRPLRPNSIAPETRPRHSMSRSTS